MTRPDRIADAIDRAHAEARRALTWHPEYYRRALRHYGWRLERKTDTGQIVVATGRTFTKAGTDRAWYRAYLRALHGLSPRPAVETSPAANRFRSWVR